MALIPSQPRQRNALWAIIGAVAAAALFWNFWLTPKQATISEQSDRLEMLDGANEAAQILAVRGGADLEENLATFERHVRRLEELVPAADEVAQLILDVNTVAREVGVEPLGVTPNPAEPGVAYTRRTYDTQWVGEYHDMGEFLARIATLSRIITPIEFSIQPYAGNVRYPRMTAPVEAFFTLETYALPDPNAPGAIAAPAGGGP